jgi:hypothetical protein
VEATLGTVQRLVTLGASIVTSGALHCAAAHSDAALLEGLLNMCDDLHAAADAPARNGVSPLMRAARPHDHESMSMCQLLIRRGASKELLTPQGETAYGLWRKSQRSRMDFLRCMGLPQSEGEGSDLKQILMPASGPTQADLACFRNDGNFDADSDFDY